MNKSLVRIVALTISASLSLDPLSSSVALCNSSPVYPTVVLRDRFHWEALAETAVPFDHRDPYPDHPYLAHLLRVKLRDRLPTSRPFRYLYEGTSAQSDEPGHLDYTGPDWQRLNIVGWVALEKLEEVHRDISIEELLEGSRQALVDYHLPEADLPRTDAKIRSLIEYLVHIGILSKGHNSNYHLILAPDIVAIKLDAVEYISRRLHEALDALRSDPDAGAHELITLLRDFSSAVLHWPRYPAEAQLPILKAIRILPKADRKLLEQFLVAHDRLRDAPLVDAILLMFHHIPENWGARMVPYLEGADVYLVACEIWNAVGGLGRVCIYRAISMVRLLGLTFARVITHEPHYAYKAYEPFTPPEGQVRLDYAQLPTPVENLKEVGGFNVQVSGDEVPVSVSKGTNRYGVNITLIGDPGEVFTRAVYRHGHEFGAKLKRDFMSFYRQAVMEDILREQVRKYDEAQRNGRPYTPTLIFAEDGQIGPLVEYKRYLDHAVDAASVLWYAVVFFFTHTVFHREWFAREGDRGDLSAPGDATSKGIRHADAAAAVSAWHLDVIAAPRDPEARIVALTNGAFLKALHDSFMEIWTHLRRTRPDLFLEQDDWDDPTIDQYREFKREAKRRVGLNPDQIAIGSTGRLVDEKAGLKRSFENKEAKNVDAYAGAEAQIYLLANEQSHTKHLWRELEEMERNVNGKGFKGRLHIENGWDIPRQIEIMRALDVIVFDSDPGTEAAGSSEALASFFFAKVVGPSPMAGLIQKQGMPKNSRHRGSIIIPVNQSPKAYQDAIMGEIRQFKEDPSGFGEEAIFSRTLSWVLNSDISTAWDLREANRTMSFKLNPLLALVPYLSREPESEKYFRHIWVRKQLVETLEKNPEVVPLKSNNDDLKSFAVPFEVEAGDVSKKITYLVNISLRMEPGTISGIIQGAEGFSALVAPERADPNLQVDLTDTFTKEPLGSRRLGDVHQASLHIIVNGGIQILRMKKIVFPNSLERDPFGGNAAKSQFTSLVAFVGAILYAGIFSLLAGLSDHPLPFIVAAAMMLVSCALFVEEAVWMRRHGIRQIGGKDRDGKIWTQGPLSQFRERRTRIHERLVHVFGNHWVWDFLLAPFLDLVGWAAALAGLQVGADEKPTSIYSPRLQNWWKLCAQITQTMSANFVGITLIVTGAAIVATTPGFLLLELTVFSVLLLLLTALQSRFQNSWTQAAISGGPIVVGHRNAGHLIFSRRTDSLPGGSGNPYWTTLPLPDVLDDVAIDGLIQELAFTRPKRAADGNVEVRVEDRAVQETASRYLQQRFGYRVEEKLAGVLSQPVVPVREDNKSAGVLLEGSMAAAGGSPVFLMPSTIRQRYAYKILRDALNAGICESPGKISDLLDRRIEFSQEPITVGQAKDGRTISLRVNYENPAQLDIYLAQEKIGMRLLGDVIYNMPHVPMDQIKLIPRFADRGRGEGLGISTPIYQWFAQRAFKQGATLIEFRRVQNPRVITNLFRLFERIHWVTSVGVASVIHRDEAEKVLQLVQNMGPTFGNLIGRWEDYKPISSAQSGAWGKLRRGA